MVQVLAFVMMLLAMAVFVLSQAVSKGAVEMIAKAANIEVSADAGVVELTTKVLEILKEAGDARRKSAGTTAPSLAAPNQELQDRAPEPAEQAATGPPSALRAPVKKIAGSALRRGVPETIPDGQRLSVTFATGSFVLDGAAQRSVKGFAQEHLIDKGAKVLVRGFASPASGALSEARRLAYYRAITVRKDLLARNVPAADIRVLIVDTPDVEHGRTAEIIAESTPSP